jgi:hypothetical protein
MPSCAIPLTQIPAGFLARIASVAAKVSVIGRRCQLELRPGVSSIRSDCSNPNRLSLHHARCELRHSAQQHSANLPRPEGTAYEAARFAKSRNRGAIIEIDCRSIERRETDHA